MARILFYSASVGVTRTSILAMQQCYLYDTMKGSTEGTGVPLILYNHTLQSTVRAVISALTCTSIIWSVIIATLLFEYTYENSCCPNCMRIKVSRICPRLKQEVLIQNKT